MIKNKGKRTYYLYVVRKHKSAMKRKQKRVNRNYDRGNGLPFKENFLGTSYSNVINHLDSRKFELSRSGKLNSYEEVKIPKIFSISGDTDAVIKILKKAYTVCKSKTTQKIVFDYQECCDIGLSASTILDILVLAVATYRERNRNELDIEIRPPVNRYARDIILSSGLPYHLKDNSFVDFDESQIRRFETIKGVHSKKEKRAGKTATEITQYFNWCLKMQNMALNEDGKRLLSTILGEVICNCEIHGGVGSTWYTQGHYQMKTEDSCGEMQLIFLNLGETIYEGLKESSSNETKEKLEIMTKHHKKEFSSQWDIEALYTLLALQEGISRLRDKSISGYSKRGTGTVSMIEMFNNIGQSKAGLKPQMTLISGNTKIKFTDKYKMRIKHFTNNSVFGDGKKKIIAFNVKNDIFCPPDTSNVQKINEYFPGTVISLRFYLDSRYIRSLQKGGR